MDCSWLKSKRQKANYKQISKDNFEMSNADIVPHVCFGHLNFAFGACLLIVFCYLLFGFMIC